MNWQKKIIVILLVALIASTTFVAGFGLGRYVLPASPPPVANAQQKHLHVFWEAWRLVEEEFYTEKPLDYQAMSYGAIRGMLASLGDSHTMFLTPSQANLFNEDLEGKFGGIGVTVSMTYEGNLRVVRLIQGAPAEQAGLKPGDTIVEVDGQPIKGLDVAQAIGLIRGPQGTSVRLLIKRTDGSTFEVVIKRALIQIPITESRMLDNGIAYLALRECNARAAHEVHESLKWLLEQNPHAFILDLRGNPGGYLHIAIEIASEFIADGLLVIERNSDGTETHHKARGDASVTTMPLAVLVDGASASAAEIIAGAIQDHKRGVLIGERTFGKGSVQVTERLSDGSALHLTIRHWYTPAGRQIEGQGLVPDVGVEMTEADLQAQRDPQLDRAISYLRSQLSP